MCESKEQMGLFQINTAKGKSSLNEDVGRSSENVPVELSEIDDEKNSAPKKKSARNVKKSSLRKSKAKCCRNDSFRVVSKPRSRSLSVESLKSLSSEGFFYFPNNKLCTIRNDVEEYYSSVDDLSEDMKNQKIKHMNLRRGLLKHLKRSFSENRSFDEDQETHVQKEKLTRAKSCDPRYRKGHFDNHFLLRVSPSVDVIQPFKFNARKNIKRRSREENGNGLLSQDKSNSSELSSCTQSSASDLSIDSQTSLKHYFRRLLREHEMLMDYMRTKCRPCKCKKCTKKQRKKEYSFDLEEFDSSDRRRTRRHNTAGKTSLQKRRHPSERIHRSRKMSTVCTPESSRNKSAHFRDVSTSGETSSPVAKNCCPCDCYREMRKTRHNRDTFCRKCFVQELYNERGDIDLIDKPWLRGPKMVPENVRGRRSCGRQRTAYCN